MDLDFTSEVYKEQALSTHEVNYENNNTSADAFFILLKGLDYEMMDNLCIYIAKLLLFDDPHIVYQIIQSNTCDTHSKRYIMQCAYDLIHSNKPLGSKTINERNASSWISHCLYEGEVASDLASSMGLDSDTARKIGILHDVGRRFDHSFIHTIKGYEYLVDSGYEDEAICCLTHSFLPIPKNGEYKGNRCASCDPASEGFYIDESGEGVFEEGARKDDMTLFLEEYQYNMYDIILNISDLMAMSSGIVSPYDRVQDIYSRKAPDPKNSPFFKVCFINSLNRLLYKLTKDEKYNYQVNIKEFNSPEEIDESLVKISDIFYKIYSQLNQKEEITK